VIRHLLAALLSVAGIALSGGAAVADGGSPNQNLATAIVEQDGKSEFDLAVDIDRQKGGAVDHLNQARALARCTDCDATAIAFQIVLVSGEPTSVEPKNSAVAINDQCERCATYAGARQFVRVTAEPVRFTREGVRTLADVYRDLRALEHQQLTIAQLAAAVEEQEGRVNQVLDTELVPVDDDHDDVKKKHSDDNEEDDEG
jgi:putative peptide zinc metalloprotease protein